MVTELGGSVATLYDINEIMGDAVLEVWAYGQKLERDQEEKIRKVE